ncbi:MAG: hypothetical protein U0324_02620 [Polyangiales bacterium]
MKPPAPRTLAGTPSPQLRPPRAASADARFPSLALVLAGGAALPACADPVCGETRGDELEAHGAAGVQAARRGEGSEALREIGVALGVVTHPTVTRRDTMTPAGAPPPVELTPPVRPNGGPAPVLPPPPVDRDTRMQPSGGPAAVRPHPTPPPTPPPAVVGARRPTSPHPQTAAPPTPVPPTVTPAPAQPTASPTPERGARRGDVAAVGVRAPRTRT